ncbi:translesion DNA synthesis-associated protein ImuA [Marinobacteraceae bacterium S3BR75-40.1]
MTATPTIHQLLKDPRIWQGRRHQTAPPTEPSGYPELDRQLAGGGWPKGALTELLLDQPGIGELQLLLPLMRRLTGRGQAAIWVNPPHVPYAPALVRAGIDIRHLVVVQAPEVEDQIWSCDQALRNPGCGLVLAWPERLKDGDIRRLQLAAEAGSSLGILLRPMTAAGRSSAAALRLTLQRPEPDAQLHVEILKSRGGWQPGQHALSLPPVTAEVPYGGAVHQAARVIQGPWH